MFEQGAVTGALFGALLITVILKAVGGKLSWVNDEDDSLVNSLIRLGIAGLGIWVYLAALRDLWGN